METWKAFEQNVVTHSVAHHLMTISHLLKEKGYARVTDVAKSLDITRGSASITLKTLKEKGFVKEDENKFLRLSKKGKDLSHAIESMRFILIRFLKDVLGVEAGQAEIDACKMEHLISPESGEKLLQFVKFLFSEDQQALAFLEAYARYECTCHGSTEECGVCETECLMQNDSPE
ncbi:MAG: metal-dependent transcriptional regulator [bacterium]